MNNEPKYMNQNVDAKESLKKKDKDYIPEVLALSGLGLYGIDALRHGPKKANKHVKAGIKKGVENIKIPFKGPAGVAMNVGKRAVGKARPIIKAQDNAFDSFRLKKMEDAAKQNGQNVRYSDKVSKDQLKAWKKEFKDNMTKADDVVNKSFNRFKDEHGFAQDFEFSELSEAEKGKFKTTFEKEYKRRLKSLYDIDEVPFNKVDMTMEFGFDPIKNVGGGGKSKSGGFSAGAGVAAGGFATGLAIGGGQLTAHALGDKYFDKKDNDQVRQLIRESYRNTDKNSQSLQTRANKVVYQNSTPRPYNQNGQRPYNQNGQRPYNSNNKPYQNKGPYIKKEAGLSKEFTQGRVLSDAEATAAKHLANKKDAAKSFAEAIVDPMIFTGGPLLVSRALNKDIKNGFVPLENPDGTVTDDIKIDVPLETLNKKASVRPKIIVKGAPQGFSKVVDDVKHDEIVADFIKGRRRNLIKAVPWSITTGMIARDLDPRIKARDQVSETPVPEGYARITISAAPKTAPQDDTYMIGKTAKNANEDHDRSDDIDEFLKKLRKSMYEVSNQEPDAKKAVAYEPKEGITGKSKQFTTLT